LRYVNQARSAIQKLNQQVDTGLKVITPGDSNVSAIIEQYRQSLDKIDSYKNRTASVQSFLTFQDDALSQVGDLINRAREIAAQAANSTNSPETRAQMAEEVFQLRDHLMSIANSQYQGKYVWGGAADTVAPYQSFTYTAVGGEPAGALNSYQWDGTTAGRTTSRHVNIAEGLTLTVDTPGNGIFDTALEGLDRLGRSLAGYTTNPASGAPNGTGAAYTFPTDYAQQTADLNATIDLLDSARTDDIEPERVSLGGKLRRIDTAQSLLELAKGSAQEALDTLQNADIAESASNLTQAQTVLQAALTVTGRVLNQSIVDYL
jgi:flagellar hook-associated protein 3 FlgL